MPALIPTNFKARVVWLGRVPNRDAALDAVAVQELTLSFSGPKGEAHAGLTRPACSRVRAQYDVGSEIRNTRQLSIVSEEELGQIALAMGLETVDPAWLGVSIVIRGIAEFTLIPPSSRLQVVGGASLVVDMENRPCQLPARVIEAAKPGFGKVFKPAAKNLRGVTAWVEQEGTIRLGDSMVLHVPDQDQWPHLAEARTGR